MSNEVSSGRDRVFALWRDMSVVQEFEWPPIGRERREDIREICVEDTLCLFADVRLVAFQTKNIPGKICGNGRSARFTQRKSANFDAGESRDNERK